MKEQADRMFAELQAKVNAGWVGHQELKSPATEPHMDHEQRKKEVERMFALNATDSVF